MNAHASRSGIPPRPSVRRLNPLVRFHRSEGGQAIFVVVVFFFLLAGLLFLILNGGQKLNHKVQMQHAADATAATGAAWYARGMNVIAMCNVTETQLLSLIVLLDTLETVVPPAQECIDDLCRNIGASKAGHDIPIDDRIADWLAVGNASSEREVIEHLGRIVSDIHWPEYLDYDSGVLWQCAELMDGFMHAMKEVTPLAAQREAIDIAQENGAEVGFILPLWPELPVVDGRFKDFENPMRIGRLPPPDSRKVIGGFAHVMNYRGYYPDYLYNGQIQHGRGPVMGPWSYWREPFVATRPLGMLDISRFSVLFNLVSSKKLEMMFGDTDTEVSLRNWEMDYDKARNLKPGDIQRSWWESASFSCRYPFPQSSFFANIEQRHYHRPTVSVRARKGWWDLPKTRAPRSSQPPMPGVEQGVDVPEGWQRATEAWEGADPRQAVWYAVTKHWTTHFPQLGIFASHPPIRPDGTRWEYTDPSDWKVYYRVKVWRFDGAELESDESLHRRYLPPGGKGPVAPILFDRAAGAHTWDTVNRYFTFNGFAYRSGKVTEWEKRPTFRGEEVVAFGNPNPIEDLIAYAQARVYCRFSWDTFTQHWKVRLMRTDRWNYLKTLIGAGFPAQGSEVASVLTPERLEPVAKLLEYYDQEFVKEFTH